MVKMPQGSRYKRRSKSGSRSRDRDRAQSPRRSTHDRGGREREPARAQAAAKSRSRSREKQNGSERNPRKRSPDPIDKTRAYSSSAPGGSHHRDEGIRESRPKVDARESGGAPTSITFNPNSSATYEHLFHTSSSKGYGPSTSSRSRGRDEDDIDSKIGKLSRRFGGGAVPKKIEIEENITIDIRRRHVGNEPPIIRPIDVETEFVMVHSAQKSTKPIFERPELKGLTSGDGRDPDAEVFPEQRVIRVDSLTKKPESTSRRRREPEVEEREKPSRETRSDEKQLTKKARYEEPSTDKRPGAQFREPSRDHRQRDARPDRRDSSRGAHGRGSRETRGISARLGNLAGNQHGGMDARGIIENRGRDRSRDASGAHGDPNSFSRPGPDVSFDARNLLLGKRQFQGGDDEYGGKLGRFGNQGVMGGHPNMGNNNMGSSRGGGLFSKAVGGLVLERLGIRADDLIGALPVIPQQLLDPTIVPKKAYFYEHDDRGDDDGWDGGFRGGFRGRGFRGRGFQRGFQRGFRGRSDFGRGGRGERRRDFEPKTSASAEEIDERIARREALKSQNAEKEKMDLDQEDEERDDRGNRVARDIFVRGRWLNRGVGMRGRGMVGRGNPNMDFKGGYYPSRVPSRDKWEHDMYEKVEKEGTEGADEEDNADETALENIAEGIEIHEGGLDVQDASAFEEKNLEEEVKPDNSSDKPENSRDKPDKPRDKSDNSRDKPDNSKEKPDNSRDKPDKSRDSAGRGRDRQERKERSDQRRGNRDDRRPSERSRSGGRGRDSDRRDRDKDRRRGDDGKRRERRSDDVSSTSKTSGAERKSVPEKRHHSPDSTKTETNLANDAASIDTTKEKLDSSIPPPPSKWEKEEGTVNSGNDAKLPEEPVAFVTSSV